MRKQRDYYVAEVSATHTVIKCRQKPSYRMSLSNRLAYFVVNAGEPLPKASAEINPQGLRYTAEELYRIRDMRKILKDVSV